MINIIDFCEFAAKFACERILKGSQYFGESIKL